MTKPFVPVIYGAPADRPDEAEAVAIAAGIAASLDALGYASETVAIDLDLTVLEALARRRPLLVFNMVESLRGDARLGHLAAAMLDHLGLAYTGARALPYLLTSAKPTAKELMRARGLPTPDWWTGQGTVPPDARVIVKSTDEHASLGMDPGSVVPGARARSEIAARELRFGGRFFAEEFVDGREFNVAVLQTARGPEVLPIPEMTFEGLARSRPRIVDYEAKWATDSHAYESTRRRFGCEAAEPVLARELGRLALACWRGFELTGYARIDFRVRPDGRPTILEVNVNPCLAPDAGFAMTAAEAGLGYTETIGEIARAGLAQAREAA